MEARDAFAWPHMVVLLQDLQQHYSHNMLGLPLRGAVCFNSYRAMASRLCTTTGRRYRVVRQ